MQQNVYAPCHFNLMPYALHPILAVCSTSDIEVTFV